MNPEQLRSRAMVGCALAIVPLAVISVAWTVHLVGPERADSAAPASALPDGVSLPTEALEFPASYSRGGRLGLGVPQGAALRIVQSAATNGIPSAALNAYQRAESVINAADKACNLPWQLIAAIGRVESDHGRYGGNTLGTDGVSRPGIFGIPLDGTRSTATISDTDAGQYDNDAVWDRAVGPMQFIPSTWSVVGVDADGDAKRNPQDIDDAGLASAVYLCSGPGDAPGGDLSTEAGRRKALYRYNHSTAYVDLVLSIMGAYIDGEYTSVPNYTTSAITFTRAFSYAATTADTQEEKSSRAGTGATGGSTGGAIPTHQMGEPSSPAATTGLVKPVDEAIGKIVKQPTQVIEDTVKTVFTLPQAILKCTAKGYSALLTSVEWKACIHDFTY